jgi:transcriptional regulator with XRE-family HTH domain
VEIDRHAIVTDEERFYLELGETFRRLRITQNLTQEDVARALGLSRTSVTNIEKGNQKILAFTLFAAADVFKVEPSELLHAQRAITQDMVADDVPHKAKTWIESVLTGVSQS